MAWHRSEGEALWESHDGSHPLSIRDLEGTWMNVDCPREKYVIDGLKVTRTDGRGARDFSLRWDAQSHRWEWGTRGRLFLEWMTCDAIAWVPTSHHARVWRWQRCVLPLVPSLSSWRPAAFQNQFDTATGPWRPLRHSGRVSADPYSSHRPGRHSHRDGVSTSLRPPPEVVHPPRSGNSNTSGSGTGGSGSVNQTPRAVDRSGHHGQQGQHERSHEHYRSPGGHGGHGCHGSHAGRERRHRRLEADSRLPCGLTPVEVYDLLSRDITPEDYDTLLRLDARVAKPTASADVVDELPGVPREDFQGESCSVCLTSFDDDDEVARLPCDHRFHRACISRWLSECRRTCPICAREATSA